MSDKFIALPYSPIQLAVQDVTNAAIRDGLNKLPELVCYNIAAHTRPGLLTEDQAETYITQMKRLLSVHYVQRMLSR